LLGTDSVTTSSLSLFVDALRPSVDVAAASVFPAAVVSDFFFRGSVPAAGFLRAAARAAATREAAALGATGLLKPVLVTEDLVAADAGPLAGADVAGVVAAVVLEANVVDGFLATLVVEALFGSRTPVLTLLPGFDELMPAAAVVCLLPLGASVGLVKGRDSGAVLDLLEGVPGALTNGLVVAVGLVAFSVPVGFGFVSTGFLVSVVGLVVLFVPVVVRGVAELIPASAPAEGLVLAELGPAAAAAGLVDAPAAGLVDATAPLPVAAAAGLDEVAVGLAEAVAGLLGAVVLLLKPVVGLLELVVGREETVVDFIADTDGLEVFVDGLDAADAAGFAGAVVVRLAGVRAVAFGLSLPTFFSTGLVALGAVLGLTSGVLLFVFESFTTFVEAFNGFV